MLWCKVIINSLFARYKIELQNKRNCLSLLKWGKISQPSFLKEQKLSKATWQKQATEVQSGIGVQ